MFILNLVNCHKVYLFLLAALKRYNEINNVLPDRIIVYRDGVGDGQVNQC